MLPGSHHDTPQEEQVEPSPGTFDSSNMINSDNTAPSSSIIILNDIQQPVDNIPNPSKNDIAISFYMPSSPMGNHVLSDSRSSESASFSPSLLSPLHHSNSCNDPTHNHNGGSKKKPSPTGFISKTIRKAKRAKKLFGKIFMNGSNGQSTSPLIGGTRDLCNRSAFIAQNIAKWINIVVVALIGLVLNTKKAIENGSYSNISKKQVMEFLSTQNITDLVKQQIQNLKNMHPDLDWIIGHIQQFVSFFLLTSSSRTYKLSFNQHQQLKAHFLLCVAILGYSLLEIFVGLFYYGKSHHHHSSSANNDNKVFFDSLRNHGFFVGLLIIFSGFYMLHRALMFLIDLIVIYMKSTQEFNQSKQTTTIITKSSLGLQQNGEDESSLIETFNDKEQFKTLEEGRGRVNFFSPYTFTVWKRLRVLLRFANAVYAIFLALSIFSEMVQHVLTIKFGGDDHTDIPSKTDVEEMKDLRIGFFTYFIILTGLTFNGLSIYLFGNFADSDSYLQKKNEELSQGEGGNGFSAFLQSPPSDKRKQASNQSMPRSSSRYSSWNNTAPWFQQQISSFSLANSPQSIPHRVYTWLYSTIWRVRIPMIKFWVYRSMREGHIHFVLFLYLKIIYFTSAGLILDFMLCLMSTMTCIFFAVPVLKANGKVLLQTTPESLSAHLNTCVKEASSMVDGVLECHTEHFWTLNSASLDEADEEEILANNPENRKQEIIGTLKVRVANEVQVDHQKVLQSVRRIFCGNGLLKENNLTVQVEKNTILGLEKLHTITSVL